jgi:hypothetical protein
VERVNEEIKTPHRRRQGPQPRRLLRLAGSVLVEIHDQWQVSERHYLSEGSIALLNTAKSAEDLAPTQLFNTTR